MESPGMELDELQQEAAKWPKASWDSIQFDPAAIKAMQMGQDDQAQ